MLSSVRSANRYARRRVRQRCRRGATCPVADEVACLSMDPLECVPARRLRHPSDRAQVPDVASPLLTAGSIVHRDVAVLGTLDRHLSGTEAVEMAANPCIVELAVTWSRGEHRELDERTVSRLGQHVEEGRRTELIGVEVHQRGDQRFEHRVLRADLPASEVLPERMANCGVAVCRGHPSALQHQRGSEFSLGELHDPAVRLVPDVDDVLGDESDVAMVSGRSEDCSVVVAAADPAVDASARRTGRSARSPELTDGLPAGKAHPELIPGPVGEVGERRIARLPRRPRSGRRRPRSHGRSRSRDGLHSGR